MRGKQLTDTQQAWYDLATLVLGRAKVDELDGNEGVDAVLNVSRMVDGGSSPMGGAHDTPAQIA